MSNRFEAGFTGFNDLINVPTYDLKTPQGLYELTIKSLTIKEENILRTSMRNTLTAKETNLLQHINNVIWNSIVNKDTYPELSTYNGFLQNISTEDRMAILTGLYHSTYGDIFDYTLSCPKCGHSYKTKIHLTDGFSIEWYQPNEEDSNLMKDYQNVEYKLPHSDSIVFALEPISLSKENSITRQLPNVDEELLEFVAKIKYFRFNPDGTPIKTIQQIENEKKEGEEPTKDTSVTLVKPLDILGGVESLLTSQKKIIVENYKRDIERYSIDMAYISHCPNCQHEFRFNVNFVGELFRVVFES